MNVWSRYARVFVYACLCCVYVYWYSITIPYCEHFLFKGDTRLCKNWGYTELKVTLPKKDKDICSEEKVSRSNIAVMNKNESF